jgi:hypothetical protein
MLYTIAVTYTSTGANKCYKELYKENTDIVDFIDNKISEFYIKWAGLKDKIIMVRFSLQLFYYR